MSAGVASGAPGPDHGSVDPTVGIKKRSNSARVVNWIALEVAVISLSLGYVRAVRGPQKHRVHGIT